ncbi:MAG: class I SAM-dependent methyltransferase [Bacteroidota bacterium]
MNLTKKPQNYFALERPEMLEFVPLTAKKILEFGCGEGNFGNALKSRNEAEVWGLEIEEDAAKIAQQKLHKVVVGDALLKLNDLPDHYFDAIIFNDVLEHLVDPYTVLKELTHKLCKGGVIVASIPNIRFFRSFFDFVFRGNWEYTPNGIMDKTHILFFTKKSIDGLFSKQGYTIVTKKGINKSKSIRPLIASILTLGAWSDIAYLQFAVVAKAK